MTAVINNSCSLSKLVGTNISLPCPSSVVAAGCTSSDIATGAPRCRFYQSLSLFCCTRLETRWTLLWTTLFCIAHRTLSQPKDLISYTSSAPQSVPSAPYNPPWKTPVANTEPNILHSPQRKPTHPHQAATWASSSAWPLGWVAACCCLRLPLQASCSTAAAPLPARVLAASLTRLQRVLTWTMTCTVRDSV